MVGSNLCVRPRDDSRYDPLIYRRKGGFMKNKVKKAAGGTAAVAAVAAAAVILNNAAVEIPYEIEKSEYSAYMTLDVPEDISADIVELYANNQLVCRSLLPGGRLETVPIVYSGLENLSLKLYERGNQIGEAEFDGEMLLYRRAR